MSYRKSLVQTHQNNKKCDGCFIREGEWIYWVYKCSHKWK